MKTRHDRGVVLWPLVRLLRGNTKCPDIFSAEEIRTWTITAASGGRWVLARPMGYRGIFLWRRIRAAWLVFLGYGDVLTWVEPNNPVSHAEERT